MRGHRRRFLQQALATAGAAWGMPGRGRAASGKLKGPIPIVDTHVHIWDLSRLRLHWLGDKGPLARSFLLDDYLEAAKGLDVVKAVYMEVDVDPSQHVAEAEYVLDLCRRKVGPMVAAVIGGRPSSDGFAAYLDRFRDRPEVKGVRQVLHGTNTPRGYGLDPKFLRGLRLLGERGLSFDLCMRPAELADGVKMVDACPGTKFVLDHCGNASVRSKDLSAWRDDISRLAERKNLVAKVSGIVASAAPDPWTPRDLAPIVEHVLSAFGPDRVVFGGDWPVCTPAATFRQWVEALKTIVRDRDAAEQKTLFHDNALRVYRLA